MERIKFTEDTFEILKRRANTKTRKVACALENWHMDDANGKYKALIVFVIAFLLCVANVASRADAVPMVEPATVSAAPEWRPAQNARTIPSWKTNVEQVDVQHVPLASALVNLGAVAGREMHDLNALYLGITGTSPEEAHIDFGENLARMWQRKLKLNVTDATRANAKMIVDRYLAQHSSTSLTDFTSLVGQQVSAVRGSLDWKTFCRNRRLNTNKCVSLTQVAYGITGEHVVAYGMTELFPNRTDGLFNANLLQVLLANAGPEYLDAIPAMGDKYASVGMWQFTSFAVKSDNAGKEGASVVNQFVAPRYQIPGSVVHLKGTDHARAAYMFALFNIANLMSKSSEQECSKLASLAKTNKVDEIAQFMAIAHHLPSRSIQNAKHWLASGAKGPLAAHTTSALTVYAQKAKNNLAGLRTFLETANHT